MRFDKRKSAPLRPYFPESSDGLCGKFVKLAAPSYVIADKAIQILVFENQVKMQLLKSTFRAVHKTRNTETKKHKTY